jgi:hypothetical protein
MAFCCSLVLARLASATAWVTGLACAARPTNGHGLKKVLLLQRWGKV